MLSIIRRAGLVAVVTLAAAGCSDTATPAAPATPSFAATAAAKPRARTLYIADLQLSSIYINLSSGYTPFTVTVTNPSRKDYTSIYIKGELQSQNNQPPWPATAFLAYCPLNNGIVPSGDCTMTGGITGGPTLTPGPATYTLRVLQQQADGTMKELDSRTVDVLLGQSY